MPPHIPRGYTGELHPEVFTIPPPQPEERKLGQLTPDQLKHFFEKGYVIVEDFFEHAEIDPCRDACDDLVEDLAQRLYRAGKIKNLYKDHGFRDRLIMIEKEWPGAVVLLLKLGQLPQAFRNLWGSEKLLNAVEQIVGPEISANPVWNLRPKVPNHLQTLVPWHQDSGYFDNTSYATMVATAWVPFVDATRENGCLEVYGGRRSQEVTGGHRKGLIAEHKCCDNFYLMLDDETMQEQLGVDIDNDVEVAEVPYGGVLFFSNCIPHRSIPMKETAVRWSVDLRFQSSDRPDGFFGLKPLVPMRSKRDPSVKVDWNVYDSANRYSILKKFELEKDGMNADVVDEFDISLTGPHMDKYDIVQHNFHVDTYLKQKEEERQKNGQ